MIARIRTASSLAEKLSPILQARLAFAAFFALAALLMGAMAMSWQATRQRDLAGRWESHTLSVLDNTANLRLATMSTMRGERGYLLTADNDFLEPYITGKADIAVALRRLRFLVADNPGQERRVDRLERHLAYYLGFMENMIAFERANQHDTAIARLRKGEGKRAIDVILADLEEFENVERGLLEQRTAKRERWSKAAQWYQDLLGVTGLFLLLLGALAAVALRNSMHRERTARRELEVYALTDELTGLANRREALGELTRQIAAERRHGRPVSVAILDIDHFKKVNDTYGHPAGDLVLRRVGEIAVQVMREQDMVGRLGGEEFIVILPDTDASHALIACDRLRAAIANSVLTLETGETLTITLSAGVAELIPGDDQKTLIARADGGLYAAKSTGRDRVLLAA